MFATIAVNFIHIFLAFVGVKFHSFKSEFYQQLPLNKRCDCRVPGCDSDSVPVVMW